MVASTASATAQQEQRPGTGPGVPVSSWSCPGTGNTLDEETELFLESATLALRLEDCAVDPERELRKIAELLGAEIDPTHLPIAPPRTGLYRYKAVGQAVPAFRRFIDELDAQTRARIETMGYETSVAG